MDKEQMIYLQQQFRLYLKNRNPNHEESTHDTKKSDAFYPLRHPNVGMNFYEVYSSRENVDYYCKLFESYWINEKKKSHKSVGAYQKAFKEFFDFFSELSENINNTSQIQPSRTIVLSSRINRKIKIADDLKKDYQNKCQICEKKLQVGEDEYYSEVHHIIPLGEPHNGYDTKDNMIVVCPNCHVQLDKGFIKINLSSMCILENHNIDEKYITYHNNEIFVK